MEMIQVEKKNNLLYFSNSVDDPQNNIYKFAFVIRPYKSCLIGLSKLLKTGISYKDCGKGSWNNTYTFKNNIFTCSWIDKNGKKQKHQEYISDSLLSELIKIVDDMVRKEIDQQVEKMVYKLKVIKG